MSDDQTTDVVALLRAELSKALAAVQEIEQDVRAKQAALRRLLRKDELLRELIATEGG